MVALEDDIGRVADQALPVTRIPLRAAIFLAVMVVTALGCAALTLLIPDDRYLRYQQLTDTIQYRSLWIYERLHFDPTPIDIAVVGPSRIGSSINTLLLEKLLAERGFPNIHAVNFSLPQSGFDLAYVLSKEVLRTKHPKVLIENAIDQMPRRGHPAFKDLGDVADVVAATKLVNVDYFVDLLKLPFRQIKLAIVAIAPEFFGYRPKFDPTRYAGSNIDTTVNELLPDGHVVDHMTVHSEATIQRDFERFSSGMKPPVLGGSIQDYEFTVSRRAYENMAKAAKSFGSTMYIYYEPYYRGPERPPEYEFYRQLAPVILADQGKNDYRLFSDARHKNHAGAAVLTALLADRLAADWRSAGGAPK